MSGKELDQLPALVPIIKLSEQKEQRPQATQSLLHSVSDILQTSRPEKEQADYKLAEKSVVVKEPLSLQAIDKKFNKTHDQSLTRNHTAAKDETYKQKECQNSKKLITGLLNQISVKNISEELFPISTKSIQEEATRLDKQIQQLTGQAEKKEEVLKVNPNNQLLKNELESLRVSVNRCFKIKTLLYEKINLRNKIDALERQVIELRQTNKELHEKIHRNKESDQNHSRNLPCYKEVQLKNQLKHCKEEWTKESEMRVLLQRNINQVIVSFKRLYEEAEQARKIVTRKLVEIEERERKLVGHNSDSESQSSKNLQQPKPIKNTDKYTAEAGETRKENQPLNEHKKLMSQPESIGFLTKWNPGPQHLLGYLKQPKKRIQTSFKAKY